MGRKAVSADAAETFCLLASQCVRSLEGFTVNVFGWRRAHVGRRYME